MGLRKDEKRRIGELAIASQGERIRLVFDLLCELRWNTSVARYLTDAWKLERSEVDQIYRTAVKLFRDQIGDADDMRGLMLAKLDHITNDAMGRKRAMVCKDELVEVPDPDHKAAVLGIREMAKLAGLHVSKQQVSVRYEEYSKESLQALLERAEDVLKPRAIETTGEAKHEALPATGIRSLPSGHRRPDSAAGVRDRSPRSNPDRRRGGGRQGLT